MNGAESDLTGIFKNFSVIAEDVSVRKRDDTTDLYYLRASSKFDFEVTPFSDRPYGDNFSIYPSNDVVDGRISRDK